MIFEAVATKWANLTLIWLFLTRQTGYTNLYSIYMIFVGYKQMHLTNNQGKKIKTFNCGYIYVKKNAKIYIFFQKIAYFLCMKHEN